MGCSDNGRFSDGTTLVMGNSYKQEM